MIPIDATATPKAHAIAHIVETMRAHAISPDELGLALQSLPQTPSTDATLRSRAVVVARTLLSWLGGIFIFAGISVYSAMFWSDMPRAMHVFLTLGVGFMLLCVLLLALREGKFPRLLLPLTLAQALMQSMGWFFVWYDYFPRTTDLHWVGTCVFGIMAAQQAFIVSRYHRTSLVFTTLYFTYAFLDQALSLCGVSNDLIALLLGGSLIMVAQGLEKTPHRVLSACYFFIGAYCFNVGLYAVVGSQLNGSMWSKWVIALSVLSFSYGLQWDKRHPWLVGLGYFISSYLLYYSVFELVRQTPADLILLVVCFVMLYVCIVLRSRMLLMNSVIAMLVFIGYYTNRYFVNSVSWPVILILLGVAFFAVAGLACKMNKKLTGC